MVQRAPNRRPIRCRRTGPRRRPRHSRGPRQRLAVSARAVPLPSAAHVRAAMLSLRQASCAVVGAAPSLGRCAARHTVCSHDVVIRVNDHPPLDGCRRTDIAVQNQFACVPAINASLAPLAATDADAPFVDERGVVRETRGGAADRKRWPSSLKRQPCRTRLPRLFRLRTEWVAPLAAGRARAPCVSHRWADINCKPRSAEYHAADGAWLSSGVASRAAHAERPPPAGRAVGGGERRRRRRRVCARGVPLGAPVRASSTYGQRESPRGDRELAPPQRDEPLQVLSQPRGRAALARGARRAAARRARLLLAQYYVVLHGTCR